MSTLGNLPVNSAVDVVAIIQNVGSPYEIQTNNIR